MHNMSVDIDTSSWILMAHMACFASHAHVYKNLQGSIYTLLLKVKAAGLKKERGQNDNLMVARIR